MDALLVGFVLHVLACAKDGDVVTHNCTEIPTRETPLGLYSCQRAMALAVERIPSVPSEAFGLGPGTYHFEFSCEPDRAGGV